MKQFRVTILLIATSMLLCACPKNEVRHYYVTIINKSKIEIGFQDYRNYEDTFFYCQPNGGYPYIQRVSSNSSVELVVPASELSYWEQYINKGQTINIFITDANVFYEYWQQPCDTIRKYVPILHRYQLTLQDLQRMDWTVVYPPEE